MKRLYFFKQMGCCYISSLFISIRTIALRPRPFRLEPSILLTILETSNDCRTFRERRLSVEFGIRVWMKSNVFVLNMQIWRQRFRAHFIQWQVCVHRCLIKCDYVI